MVLASGLTDQPLAERDNRTPLQLAETPHLDRLARHGRWGSVQTLPERLDPGNEVSFLSLLGYDPETYPPGPAAFEARALGVSLEKGEVPLCCDFVILQSSHNDMVMKDYTGGHLSDEDARPLLKALQDQVTGVPVRFVFGSGNHHLMLIRSQPFEGRLTPPQELIGEGIRRFMPEGDEFKDLVYVMNQAQIILHNHPFNRKRQRAGEDAINSVWFWGPGPSPALPPFAEQFGRPRAAVVTASLLLQGMARAAGMSVVPVDGATGFSDTHYPGKVQAVLNQLESNDVVYLHLGAAEELSLKGLLDDKILAIEDFDRQVLGPLLQSLDARTDVRILVAVNHMCSANRMKYTRDPVPFVVYPARGSTPPPAGFDEGLLESGGDHFPSGAALIEAFFNNKLS